MIRVTAAEVVRRHTLRLRFNDGAVGELDFGPELWGEMFEPLRDEALFNQVRVDDELGTIVWPNGADFDPEGLRAAIEAVTSTA